MRLHKYVDPAVFLDQVLPLLEVRESVNNMILGVANHLAEHPEWIETAPYLSVVEEHNERLVLASVLTPTRNLLIAGDPLVEPAKREEALAILASDLLDGQWRVPGVNAENDLAEAFTRLWQALAGKHAVVKMRERVYELREVIFPHNPPPGFFRLATMEDYDVVVRWHYAFSVEALAEGDQEASRLFASRRIPNQNVGLWDLNGPVSMCARTRSTRRGYTITGVYTPPNLRGRGYASACVAAMSRNLLNSGKQFISLFTDLANPTSNAIYQKIGYQPLCDFTNYQFE